MFGDNVCIHQFVWGQFLCCPQWSLWMWSLLWQLIFDAISFPPQLLLCKSEPGKNRGVYLYIYICMWYMYFASLCFCLTLCIIPVVPHRAAAEVSKIGHYRRGDLLWCTDGRANPLMDVVGAVFFAVVAMVAVVTSPTTAGCSVA